MDLTIPLFHDTSVVVSKLIIHIIKIMFVNMDKSRGSFSFLSILTRTCLSTDTF